MLSTASVVQEVRIYRDTVELDPNNLPAPIATVGGGVETYVDTVPDNTVDYFYRLGVVVAGEESFSDNEMALYGDLAAGRVARYTMDNIANGVIADEMGIYPATLVNGTVVPGKFGDAVAFDLNAPTYAETSQRVPHGGSAITVAAWVRLRDPAKSGAHWVLNQRSDPVDNTKQEWRLQNNSDSGQDSTWFWISADSGASYYYRHPTDIIATDEWVH